MIKLEKELKEKALSDLLDQQIEKKGLVKQSDLIQMTQEPDGHVHATHSTDKFCKNCGEKNADYVEPETICADCHEPLGSEKETKDFKACKNCGSHNAYSLKNLTDEEKKEILNKDE